MFSINIGSYLATRKVLIFSNKKKQENIFDSKISKNIFFFVFKNKKEGVLNPFYLFFENYFKNNYG